MTLTRLPSPEAAAAWLAARVAGTLVADSRRVSAGDGFIAWPGQRADGRSFVAAALAAGAAACLVEDEGVEAFGFEGEPVATLPRLKACAGAVAHRFFGRPSEKLDVVAVTGTNGKTSTSWWTAQALTQRGRRCAVMGTLGVGPLDALEPSALTTPDPVSLHAAMKRLVDAGLAGCALEASSIGLVEHRLDALAIDVAVFTNLTQDHLDYHGSMQAYWAAKRRLFDWPGLRAAVVNIDDEAGDRLAAELRGREIDLWTVSAKGTARLMAQGVQHRDGGLSFDVSEGDARVSVAAPVVGDYNVSNLLGVIGALRAFGLSQADAALAVATIRPVPGRLQRVGETLSPAVIVDYAHTPDALEKALQALRPLARSRGGKLWCVFGCGGDRDPAKRPLMGAIAACRADHVVITSDNPRSESPHRIVSQILAGAAGHAGVDVIEDRAEAIAHAVRSAADEDVVLLAGKGHEDYQEVAGVKRPFSDAQQSLARLREREART